MDNDNKSKYGQVEGLNPHKKKRKGKVIKMTEEEFENLELITLGDKWTWFSSKLALQVFQAKILNFEVRWTVLRTHLYCPAPRFSKP